MKLLPYRIEYEFCFTDGTLKKFEILLDPKSIVILRNKYRVKPFWARLEYEQCKCCTLDPATTPFCPIALNIAEMVESFKDAISSDQCVVRCVTPERIYVKDTYVQEGLHSIFGIIMATSDCPVMGMFKPMARFHLPFSTPQETVFRFVSSYMLRQYFVAKKGNQPDLSLTKIERFYEKVQLLNEGILARITQITENDADRNAIVILTHLAQIVSMEIGESLDSFEYLFDSIT